MVVGRGYLQTRLENILGMSHEVLGSRKRAEKRNSVVKRLSVFVFGEMLLVFNCSQIPLNLSYFFFFFDYRKEL